MGSNAYSEVQARSRDQYYSNMASLVVSGQIKKRKTVRKNNYLPDFFLTQLWTIFSLTSPLHIVINYVVCSFGFVQGISYSLFRRLTGAVLEPELRPP